MARNKIQRKGQSSYKEVKGKVHSEQGDVLWQRAEDGPTKIKPKWSEWPKAKGNK